MNTNQDEIPLFDASAASLKDQPLTPAQCRAAMERMSRTNPLIHKVLMTRDIQGLSGEDTYSLLAYYALKSLQAMTELNLELLKNSTANSLTCKH